MLNILSNTTNLQEVLEVLQTKAIPNGVELPELENEGGAGDLLAGKELIDSEGKIVEGTIPTKTAADLTARGALVTVPAGYYAADAIKSVSTATQATPSVSIDADGKITATATQTAGYVSAGTKTGTKQLTTQAAKTVTPTKSSQTAVAKDVYTTGAITVAAIPDTYIQPSGTKTITENGIYDVKNYASATIDIESLDSSLITRDITTYTNDQITLVGDYAFANCSSLTLVSFPVCGTISYGAFQYCSNLTSISFPACTSIGSYAFQYCSKLTTVSFPQCINISNDAFYQCSGLTSVSFPQCINIGNNAFYHCSRLTSVSFPVCTTIGEQAFYNCFSLTSVSFPKCETIGRAAFGSCYSLTSVSFPACTAINSSAFKHCKTLTMATFGEASLINTSSNPLIREAAFLGCTHLTKLTLNYSSVVTLLDRSALEFTPMMQVSYVGIFGSIYVPASLVDAYKSTTNWAIYSNRITAIKSDNEESDPYPITFTVAGQDFQGESDMTWRQWISTEYNTNFYSIEDFGAGEFIYSEIDDMGIGDETGNLVGPDLLIMPNYNYNMVPY